MNEKKLDLSAIGELFRSGYKFIRTCQECGHKQEDTEPIQGKELSSAYEFRACKKCKSEALDYGSRKYNKEVEED